MKGSEPMKVSVTGKVMETKAVEKVKDGVSKKSTEVMLHQSGETQLTRVKIPDGSGIKIPKEGETATFTGALYTWKTANGVGTMVGAEF